ncbi:CatB-related O-acetyltransferase [Confluentibacter lentus]|uniref:CatB-related O-acetyltransferase n=1 Tax=Confluentibacter lentus TaxID=1699412 RepID=UPI0012FDF673|nr:hypothetical protein [Confluentibacter lentus]
MKNRLKNILKSEKRININSALNNIAVIYFIPDSNLNKYNNWKDGFTRAINILSEDFNITWINLFDVKPSSDELNQFDFLIVKSCWDWIVDNYVRSLKNLKVYKGIMVSCSKIPNNKQSMFFYDIVWYETYWYGKQISEHPNLVHAFGVNASDFGFQNYEKDIDVLGIGALTSHKRFHKFIDLPQEKKVIVGDVNTTDSSGIKSYLENSGIKILEYTSQEELSKLINKSKLVYIPSDVNGGGERAVLESRLCNVPIKIENDNPKLKELIASPIWDEYYYSNQIRTSIQKLFNKKESTFISNRIESSNKIKAGRNSFHNGNFIVKGDEFVSIGAFCSFGNNVSIITSNHDTNFLCSQGYLYRNYFKKNHPGEDANPPNIERTKGPVYIGNDVWIGDNVTVLSGVKIGNGASIGTGTIVTKDVGDFEVHAGIPNKKIKLRFNKDIIELIQETKWWNWSDKKIRCNEKIFHLNLNECTTEDYKNSIK